MKHMLLFMMMVTTGTSAALAQATQPASTQPAQAETGLDPIVNARDQAEIRREREAEILDEFFAHVKDSPEVEPAAREAIEGLWTQRQTEDDPRAFMTSALAILSSPYNQASNALEAGDTAGALETARPLVDSTDFYLSTHASSLAARALIEEDRFDEARELLEDQAERRDEIVARTFLAPEMTFLLGYCQLSNLDYESAAATFEEFERRFPDAPEQYRLPVRQMLQELGTRRPEELGDVSDLMGYAGRQLRHVRAGEVVQARQERAVELLSQLIEDAEQREQQQQQQQQQACKKCGGKGCPDCQPGGLPQGNQQQPQRGAERSVLPPGQGRVGDLRQSSRARPGEQWGQMRPEEREQVLQSLRQNYPSRYRQLVEQYYRQLSREDDR